MIEKWDINDVDSLKGKIIIVTGGNSGLGYESVKFFASKEAKVILASRSTERGEKAKQEICTAHPSSDIEVMELDLSSLNSIKQFCETFTDRFSRLDILLNNAGIMTTPYGLTEDGLEQQIGVNHFGHFALTGGLFEILKKTPHARIVNISSQGHRIGKMDFNNLFFEKGKGYSPLKAYSRSKLANLLFTYELNRKIKAAGLKMKVLAAHPGTSNTNLARYIEKESWFFEKLTAIVLRATQSAYEGALPGIRASLDPTAKGGQYYGPDGFFEMTGNPVLVTSNKASGNKTDSKKLWELSEEVTKIRYSFD